MQREIRRLLMVGLGVIVGVVLVSQAAAAAQTEPQELLLPFSAGVIEVQADETYEGDTLHPSIGEIAFDLTDVRRSVDTPVLAIGDGRVRVECVHRSGSAVLAFQADGYSGDFHYTHVDGNALARGVSSEWTRVVRGQQLARLYPDALVSERGDHCAQFSTGPHLHFDLPSAGIEIDGVVYTANSPNDGAQVSSTNRRPNERSSAICSGLDATVVGTSGDDVLQGTPGPDVIAGLQGDDLILGLEGDDVICGGLGDDFLIGNDGFDVIFGAQGDDTILAANGSTGSRLDDPDGGGRFFGGQGNDVIFGSNRWDRMQGGAGDDSLHGFNGRDWMRGGAGEDVLEGGNNIDDLHGGNGSDLMIVGSGDRVAGGASQDTCELTTRPGSIRGCEILV